MLREYTILHVYGGGGGAGMGFAEWRPHRLRGTRGRGPASAVQPAGEERYYGRLINKPLANRRIIGMSWIIGIVVFSIGVYWVMKQLRQVFTNNVYKYLTLFFLIAIAGFLTITSIPHLYPVVYSSLVHLVGSWPAAVLTAWFSFLPVLNTIIALVFNHPFNR